MTRSFLVACGLAAYAIVAGAATTTVAPNPALTNNPALGPAKVAPSKPASAKPALAKGAKNAASSLPKMTAAQIAEQNVAARGGAKTWEAISTLTLSGELGAGGKKEAELAFTMRMKRPHKSRLEIQFKDQTAVQVYDGQRGWKYRPFLGRKEIEPYTAEEAKSAAGWAELDGPLVDYAAKGTKIALIGTEMVEDHATYKLELTMKDGRKRNLWVDGKTFLEAKIDGEPRRIDGRMHPVAIFYRDYKTESGVLIPHELETVVDGVMQSHKMTIERVAVNQPMADALFTKDQMMMVASAPSGAAR